MLESLQTPPAPAVTTDQAAQIAADLFGATGAVAHPLPGERAQNFRLVADCGELVLRIAHPADSGPPAHTQSAVLHHLERTAPELPIPRLGLFRATSTEGPPHEARRWAVLRSS